MTRVKFRVCACCEARRTALPEVVCCVAHDFISKTGARMPDAQLMVLPQAVFFQKNATDFADYSRSNLSVFQRENCINNVRVRMLTNEKKFQFITEVLTATLQFCP
jgi:hypothetical protein